MRILHTINSLNTDSWWGAIAPSSLSPAKLRPCTDLVTLTRKGDSMHRTDMYYHAGPMTVRWREK
jgi:hypothetical protein